LSTGGTTEVILFGIDTITYGIPLSQMISELLNNETYTSIINVFNDIQVNINEIKSSNKNYARRVIDIYKSHALSDDSITELALHANPDYCRS
jgi:hypothetical protein